MMAENLTDPEEVLLRQIHPNSLDGGEPASDRFRPSEADKNLLSVDRSSLTNAAKAHGLYTSGGRKSAAVFGLTVGEFGDAAIPCVEDVILKAVGVLANPAHALADYSSHPLKQQKLIAKRLKRLAVARGCLYPVQDPAATAGATLA